MHDLPKTKLTYRQLVMHETLKDENGQKTNELLGFGSSPQEHHSTLQQVSMNHRVAKLNRDIKETKINVIIINNNIAVNKSLIRSLYLDSQRTNSQFPRPA